MFMVSSMGLCFFDFGEKGAATTTDPGTAAYNQQIQPGCLNALKIITRFRIQSDV